MQFLIDQLVQFLIVEYDLSGAHHGVLEGEEVGDRGADRVVVLREDRLEHAEVVLRHLVNNFIKGLLKRDFGTLISG